VFFAIILILNQRYQLLVLVQKELMKLSKMMNNLDLQNVEILKNSIQGLSWNSVVIWHDEVFLEEIEMVSEVLFTKKKNLFL